MVVVVVPFPEEGGGDGCILEGEDDKKNIFNKSCKNNININDNDKF